MKKEIILLASSRKFGNLCIAGIDVDNGEWIRIISDDNRISNAVRIEDTLYSNGTAPKILDKIQIELKKRSPNYFQPENYILDPSNIWVKVGKALVKELFDIQETETLPYVFFDTEKKLHNSFLKKLPPQEKYSLQLIKPSSAIVHVRKWPERVDITISFTYNNRWYNYFSITDIEYESFFGKRSQGDYPLNNIYFVLSLGECYQKDNCHYKLITTIIKENQCPDGLPALEHL